MGQAMKPQDLLADYLSRARVMQLASSQDNKPYVVNVHYYADPAGNLYWISTRERRHSQELEANPSACVVIKVHEDTPQEQWIVGLSIEGTVEYIGEDPGDEVFEGYKSKLGKPDQLMNDVRSGTNPHKFYKLTPTTYTLFDTKNFPSQPKQEWTAA
jgi:uncharacterized protein YhbP (UPF0306 family)